MNGGADVTGDLVAATSIQERMWFAERVEPGRGLYNVPFAWRVRGTLSPAALEQALASVVERHEILRTAFVERDGRLHQSVGAPWRPELTRVDLRGRPDAEAALADWLRETTRRPFDVTTDRLLRAGLAELDGEQVLAVCAHHLVWDAASLPVFLRDLRTAYEACAEPDTGQDTWAEVDLDEVDGADHDALTALGHRLLAGLRPDAPAWQPGAAQQPASPHQERMAFIDRFEHGVVYPTPPTYHNLSLLVRVDDVPAAADLDAAIARVVARHESLRTNVAIADDAVVQRIADHVDVRAEWLPAAPAADEPDDALTGRLRRPFDVAHEPLFRVTVQPLADGTAWLALVGHHAVVDRPSLVTLAGELVAGPGDDRPTSYVGWLAGRDTDTVARDLAARARALRGEIEPVELPERRPRAAVHVYEERSVPVRLPSGLDAAAARLGVELEALLLAGFHAVLAAHTGQYELVVGTVRDRREPGDRQVVGPLTNLVPVRLASAPEQPFHAFASAAHTELAAASLHRTADFDDLVRVLNPAKDMARTALFDVLFHYVPGAGETWAGAAASDWLGGYGKYDLHLFLRQDGDAVRGRIVYNGLYFDEDQMAGFAEHLGRVLEQAAAAPGTPMSGFDLVSEEERHRQLTEWNDTAAAYPETTIHGLVLARAREFPDRVAVTSGGDHRSYRDLVANAERIAHGLVAEGVRPGDLVGLVLHRGIAQVEAMLGVLLAGGAYLPVEPSIPADRKAFIFSDSGTRWVITDGDNSDVPGAARVLSVAELTATPEAVALPEVAADDLAYCIYTSGTTGRPKGALVTHRNVVRLVRNDTFPFTFSSADVWTLFHSYSFDFSVWEVFCCLAYGGRLVVVPSEVAKDQQRFLDLLRLERVSVLNQTPSAFAQLTELALADGVKPLDSLRYVIFGGEALSPGKLAGWRRVLPELRLVNMYGITETTVHTTVRDVTDADIEADVSNIGVPIPTTTVYLLDRHNPGRLLPVGAVGEMYVGGDGVTAGYLNRPELNAERFLPDPFLGGRMFRSGDLARYRPDGTLEYLGRGDSQVKLRGYRIELGEIESCLREHPAVADAVVLLDGGSEGRLVAYVRCPDGTPELADLRAHLGTHLPSYMVPAAYHHVDRFPLTGNGKLDKRALLAQGVALSAEQSRAPVTPTGVLVAGIFARLLGVAPPGADDSFFDLGGHSLLATRLLAEITAATGVRLALRDIFQRSRVQELADHVDSLAPEPGDGPAPGEQDHGDGERVPASPIQSDMWLAERMAPDHPRYNVPLLWRVRGRLDQEALSSALAAVVARHEVLRTRFGEDATGVWQAVGAPWRPELTQVDLGGRTPAEQEAAIAELVDAAATTPFDLTSGKLLRAHLADRGAGEAVLLLCLHHMVFDAGSLPAFVADLRDAYVAALAGTTPDWAEPVQFADVARAQAAYLSDVDGEDAVGYWLERLAGAPPVLDLAPPPARQEPDGAVRVPVPADFAATCATRLAEHRTSWFMVAVTAVAAMLHRWSGADDVTMGLPVANRADEDHADVLGPCLNTVVLRSRTKDGTTFGDLLAEVREAMLDAFEFQAVPLSVVIDRLAPPRVAGRVPFLDVAVNLITVDATEHAFGDATVVPLPFDRWQHETKFGLTVTFVDDGDRVDAVLSYRGDRFTAADVRRMADWLGELLANVVAYAPAPLDTVLPATEARQYRDFAAAQAARLADQDGAGDVAYWTRELDGAPAYPSVTPPLTAGPPGSVEVDLDPAALDRLRALRDEHGLSWFMVAATGLAALLHRWTGQEDVTFGCPVANRDEFADVLGPCLNTIVLRSRCGPDTSVRELLDAMRDRVLAAFDHQWAPFEEIVDRLRPARRPGWTPYLDILLAVTTGDAPPASLGGAELEPVRLDHDGADYAGKFGLTVGFEEVAGRLRGTVMYRGDRFTEGEVARMAHWLGRFLTACGDVMDVPVRGLHLIDEAERAELARFEQGPPAMPVSTIPELFARRVAATPDAVAIRTADGVRTYRELDERANALAARLRPLATGDRPAVALLLPRGEQLVVAMLAAWRAGFLYCPLEPDYPHARIRFILDDLRAAAVITDDPAAVADLGDVPVLDVAGAADGAVPDVLSTPDPEAVAYVLYTSGTTGEPKGVAYGHRSIAQSTQWHIEAFEVTPADRVAWIHSVAFDTTEWEIWQALCSGAELLPYEAADVVAPELTAWLDEHRVTVLCTPTPLSEVMWADGAELPALRWMIFGGSPLTTVPPTGTGYRICDSYGPTETYNTTLHEVVPAEATVLNCIGRPNAGARVYMLDQDGRRCPIGVVGELHIGGTSVAHGYWNRPDMTAARFAETDPDGNPGRVYRTGDRARWLPDGTLEFLGRVDRQVKVRGYRVEPQEIESVLRADPLVGQAVVHHFAGDPVPLVGYLVAKDPAAADTQEVLARLRSALPEFMVPGALVWLPELPLNSRGKLDTAALPRPGRDDLANHTPWTAPETDLERRIVAVWSGVLGIDAVGVHDNFFDLGGNSLLLARLHSRLQADLDVRLPIRQLFEYPTVHTLAKALASGPAAAPQAGEGRDRGSRAQAARARRARRPGRG